MPIEIYEVKKSDKTDKRWEGVQEQNLPKHPFLTLICAKPKTGKSNLIVNMLYNPKINFKKRFDKIIWISPSLAGDKTLENNVMIDDDIVKMHDGLEPLDPIIDVILQDQMEHKDDENCLLILDDLVGNIRGNSISKLSAKYRHYNLSMIVVSQDYKSFAKLTRNSASHFILFRTHNEKEIKKMDDELGADFGHQFVPIFKDVTKKKFQFLTVDVDNHRLIRKFDDVLLDLNKDEK